YFTNGNYHKNQSDQKKDIELSNDIPPLPNDWPQQSNEHSTAAIPQLFSAQSYLRYQGEKFVKRFDANCYISLTRKLDAHDITIGRGERLDQVLKTVTQMAMVIGE